jgi:hypothetical protein
MDDLHIGAMIQTKKLPKHSVPEVYELGEGSTNVNTNARVAQHGQCAGGVGHRKPKRRMKVSST